MFFDVYQREANVVDYAWKAKLLKRQKCDQVFVVGHPIRVLLLVLKVTMFQLVVYGLLDPDTVDSPLP